MFERADRIGGLLRYGIPEFKMEKRVLDRRLEQMRAEGVEFVTGADVGVDVDPETPAPGARRAPPGGGRVPRRATCRSRGGSSTASTSRWSTSRSRTGAARATASRTRDFITARDKHVVILGGGDTGADCLGTVHRQGARSVHQMEILPRPPDQRAADNPWPQYPNVYRVSSAHEEGGERVYAVSTKRFLGDDRGRVRGLEAVRVEVAREAGRPVFREVPGSEFTLPCELVLLAMGFLGPERHGMLEKLGVRLTERGNVWRDASWMTSVPGVFAAGDMQRGQSLIVWAIAEGRSAARGVDQYLMGRSDLPLPSPDVATTRARRLARGQAPDQCSRLGATPLPKRRITARSRPARPGRSVVRGLDH